MKFIIDNEEYNVIINKKGNKNTYVRIDKDLNIIVNTCYFITKKSILLLLNNNKDSIKKMINSVKKKNIYDDKFYYLGKNYDVIFDSSINNVIINENNIVVKDKKTFDKWYKKEMLDIYQRHLRLNYEKFVENIPFPNLKIRQMKTRWGVCNIKTKTVTLNSLLMRYDLEKLDYVIIHELSHLIYFNHSKDFWNLVSKYCPNYKKIRAALKEH